MIPVLWACVAATAVGFGSGWIAQGWNMGKDIAELRTEHADAVATAARSALRLTEIYKGNADAAVQKAEARLIQNKRASDGLRSELDGLRGELATVPDRIGNATREAVNQYAATATAVFEQCTARYSEMAGYAAGHAADAQTLIDAWPYNQPRP